MTPYAIIQDEAFKAGLRPKAIQGHGKTKWLVECRRKIARRLRSLGMSFPEIGRSLHKHHTSIIGLLKGDSNGKAVSEMGGRKDATATGVALKDAEDV